MTVAVLSPGEVFGGVETHVLGLCTQLRSSGVVVLPVLFHDRELAARLRDVGIAPCFVRTRHRYDPDAARRLVALVEESGAHVLHLHGYRATVTAALAGSRLRTGIVKTEHGWPEPEESVVARTKTRVNRRLDDWATRRLGARVCYVTSELMQRFAAVHANLSRRVIYNGIAPLAPAERRPAGLEPDRFNIGIVGRISKVKGIGFALQALAAADGGERLRLHVIGSGPQETKLRESVPALGLETRVRFHGFQRDALGWIAHLDALLMPSLHEGLPYTLLEAMSLGIPVIASRIGGLAEVVRNEETGLLVEVGDVEGMAKAMRRLASDRELAGRLGRAAAREQRQHYSIDRMVRDYLATYAEASNAIGRAGNRRA
jgi:glycosyltransferase involved in cell wall biosynthesis